MVILLLTFLFLAGLAFLLFTFLTAQGDFTLMSKKHVKPHAFEDKVVWVTGASRGIGEALAQQLASLGAKLILSSLNEAELERVKQQLTGKHAPSQVQVLPLDLTAGEAILKEAVEKAESFFSGAGVDFMIHNASFECLTSSALEITEEGLKGMLDVKVRGTLSLTRLLAPYMLRRGSGHFIVVSSAASKTPTPGQAVYSTTKFALNGYFHALRSELCRKGIKVTIVCPGPIRTTKGRFTKKYLSTPRCAELTLIAASHGLKEAWISNQPVLAMRYLMQCMPSIGLYIMDQRSQQHSASASSSRANYPQVYPPEVEANCPQVYPPEVEESVLQLTKLLQQESFTKASFSEIKMIVSRFEGKLLPMDLESACVLLKTDFWRDWEEYEEAHSHREAMLQHYRSSQGHSLHEAVAMRDRQDIEVDKIQNELSIVDAEITCLQAKRESLKESLVVAQNRAEELVMQLDEKRRAQEEERRQLILPKSNATRIVVKETVRRLVLDDLDRTLDVFRLREM